MGHESRKKNNKNSTCTTETSKEPTFRVRELIPGDVLPHVCAMHVPHLEFTHETGRGNRLGNPRSRHYLNFEMFSKNCHHQSHLMLHP